MEEVKALELKVAEFMEKIEVLTIERDRYEKKCFRLIEDLNKKVEMLNKIEKIVFKK